MFNVHTSAAEIEAIQLKEYTVNDSVVLASNLYKDSEIESLEDVEDIDITNIETTSEDIAEVKKEGTDLGEISVDLVDEAEEVDVNLESGQVVYEYEGYIMEENNITGGVQYMYEIPNEDSQHEFELKLNLLATN